MELSRRTLGGLAEVIRQLCGLVIGPDKAYLVRHRLAPIVETEGLESFEQLLDRLRGRDGARLHDAIIEAITTKETSFFRDKAVFDALRDSVLSECVAMLRRRAGQRHRIRIWSAGCATGQEPYSVSMLIRERIDACANGSTDGAFTILATDLSAAALQAAQDGRYGPEQLNRGITDERRARHFRRSGRDWIVDEPVRRMVQFRRFDLMQPPASLGAFDLILCRNVLIYFDEPTRERVCAGLCAALQAEGWLVLGAAESLSGRHPDMERIRMGRVRLYRKRQAGG